MHLQEIKVAELVEGKTKFPVGPFRIKEYDSENKYQIKRVVLENENGELLIFQGSSYSHIIAQVQVKPEMVDKHRVTAMFGGEVAVTKYFDDEYDAKKFSETFGDGWTTEVVPTKIKAFEIAKTTTEEIPF